MFVTNLILVHVFTLINSCFTWDYVIIFQNVIWIFEVLNLGCWVLDDRCWWNAWVVDKDNIQYELVFYMLFIVFKWMESWFLDAFYL